MNHFEGHLMVPSRVVDSKVLRMAIQLEHFFSDKKAKWQKCNVRNFKRFVFGISFEVPTLKVHILLMSTNFAILHFIRKYTPAELPF